MANVVARIEIARPPEAAFAVVADPGRDPEWREEVVSVALVSGDAGTVGSEYREEVRAAGSTIAVVFRLDEIDAPRRVLWAIREPVGGVGGYELTPTGAGVQVGFVLELGGGGLTRRLVAAAIGRRAEAALRRLKEILEAAPLA